MKKFIKILTATILSVSVLAGCTSSSTTSETSSKVSGTIAMNGSTSMEKLANSLAEVFAQKYPNAIVEPQFTGSSAGIKALITGTAQIGNSSRRLKEEEKAQGIIENIVAMDGIAIITNEQTNIDSISMQQLIDIYTGKITNWNEIGGNDNGIVVIGREAGSGSRSAFEDILNIKDKASYSQEIDSNGAVVAKVEVTPNSIGYVSMDILKNSKAKSLAVDGIMPSIKTISNNTYVLARPFIMATKGSIEKQSEVIQTFFKFIKSEEGKSIVEKMGLVSVN